MECSPLITCVGLKPFWWHQNNGSPLKELKPNGSLFLASLEKRLNNSLLWKFWIKMFKNKNRPLLCASWIIQNLAGSFLFLNVSWQNALACQRLLVRRFCEELPQEGSEAFGGSERAGRVEGRRRRMSGRMRRRRRWRRGNPMFHPPTSPLASALLEWARAAAAAVRWLPGSTI